MTLILELPPATEARLREAARARGLALEAAVTEALESWSDQQVVAPAKDVDDARARRLAAIKRAHGMFQDRGRTSDDFVRERHEEAQRELEKDEARWREREARASEPS